MVLFCRTNIEEYSQNTYKGRPPDPSLPFLWRLCSASVLSPPFWAAKKIQFQLARYLIQRCKQMKKRFPTEAISYRHVAIWIRTNDFDFFKRTKEKQIKKHINITGLKNMGIGDEIPLRIFLIGPKKSNKDLVLVSFTPSWKPIALVLQLELWSQVSQIIFSSVRSILHL